MYVHYKTNVLPVLILQYVCVKLQHSYQLLLSSYVQHTCIRHLMCYIVGTVKCVQHNARGRFLWPTLYVSQ